MNSNYFYSNTVLSSRNKRFLEEVQTIAESIKQQVYVLSGPLIDSKYQYNDDSLIIVLSSKRKIAFVTTRKVDDDFMDLCKDIIEDIGSVSDKYGYKEKIGRPRKWKDRLTGIYSVKDINDVTMWFCKDIAINDADDFRTLDLLVSLFIGNIHKPLFCYLFPINRTFRYLRYPNTEVTNPLRCFMSLSLGQSKRNAKDSASTLFRENLILFE